MVIMPPSSVFPVMKFGAIYKLHFIYVVYFNIFLIAFSSSLQVVVVFLNLYESTVGLGLSSVKNKPTEEDSVLLIQDKAIYYLRIYTFCRENGVVLSLPPHSFHHIQSLDLTFFGPLTPARPILFRTTMLTKVITQKITCSLRLPLTISLSSASANSSVDQDEVSHFNKLGKKWWDEADMKPLHSLNKLRVPLIRDGLINTGLVRKDFINTPKPLTNLHILDVGCGGGILTEAIARLGPTVTGIDVASELIDIAKQHNNLDSSLSNLNYSICTVEDHAKENNERYDAVIASEVLEHVNEKEIFLEACINCLKPGGSIFITTLNQSSLSWLCGVVVAENILNIIPRGTHDWNKFIPPNRTQKLVEHYNCRTRLIHGMFYNFLTDKWSWITDTSICYALHAIKN